MGARSGTDGFQGGAHFAGALVALPGIFVQAPVDDALQDRRKRGRDRRGSLLENLRAQIIGRGATKRPAARGHFVEQDSQRPDVTAFVGFFPFQNFRRDIRKRAGKSVLRFPGLIEPRGLFAGFRFGAARDAEIEHFQASAGCHDYIGGLQVAVNYAPAVSVGQRISQLQAVPLHLFERHPRGGNFRGKRATLHKFHGDVGPAIGFANFVDGANVGVIQGGDRAGFLENALVAGGTSGWQRTEEFQSDVALKLFVAGAVHHAHATFAELVFNYIVAESLTEHTLASRKVDHTRGLGASKSLAVCSICKGFQEMR